ncbi:MAG: phytoene desaturase family protein [Opitutales bacterium]
MSSENPHFAVVGGGLAGLASACVLAARGARVTLFEKNSWLGGKAAVLEDGGYRFDMGPTILTLPSVLRRIFAEAGRDLDAYLDLRRLDPQWRCFYTDGSVLDLNDSTKQTANNLRGIGADEASVEGYEQFLRYANRLDQISQKYFFWKPVGGVADTINFTGFGDSQVLADLLSMRMGSTVAKTIRSYVNDERVAQMLDHFTQYVGSSPLASPAILCGIASMQTNEGIWYPIGGTRAVPEALVKLGGELGVEYRTEVDVAAIREENGAARGITLADGTPLDFDGVVSNCDSLRTFNELVDGQARQPSWTRKFEPACSGVVLYLGLKERYEHLAHHNFVFSENPEAEFEAIYDHGEPAEEMTCYVAAPSATEPGVAPAGGEALYVLVHAPYLRERHNWERMFADYRRKIIRKLAQTGGLTDLEDRIAVEHALTPQSIHERYRVLNGAIYGLASHGAFTGAFKPSNRSKTVRGLYLAGGSAHPGPGMPMVLMSGWIAADAASKDAHLGTAVA